MRTYGRIIRPPKGAKHMAYEEIKQEISSKHGISLSELSKLVGLKLLEKGVTEERSFDSIKDYSEIKNFSSDKPKELAILKKASGKISSCFFHNVAYSKRLKNTARARVSS